MKDDLTQLGNESIKSEGLTFPILDQRTLAFRATQQLRWNKLGELQQLWVRDDGQVLDWRTIPKEE